MQGLISPIVAALVIDCLRRETPAALADEAGVRALLAAGAGGVPLDAYRRILEAARAADGGLGLLRAGEGLRTLQHPLLFVLLNSDAPELVVEKEGRLAAFFHSRHRVRIAEHGDHSLTLRHESAASEPPLASESLASCAQHIVLLEEIGCRELRLRLPESQAPERVVYDSGAYARPPDGEGLDCWAFEWSHFSAARKPMPGLDEMLLDATRERVLDEQQGPAAAVERVLRRDLGRTWKIADVAAALETSPRSLQRALGAAGERYSDVVDRVRNDEAARLLRDTALSITEIGFVCGFSDSAHFSRSFRRRRSMTPTEFRAASV